MSNNIFDFNHISPDLTIEQELEFSNSLIIYQVRTKEITTVKEVWIPGLN